MAAKEFCKSFKISPEDSRSVVGMGSSADAILDPSADDSCEALKVGILSCRYFVLDSVGQTVLNYPQSREKPE